MAPDSFSLRSFRSFGSQSNKGDPPKPPRRKTTGFKQEKEAELSPRSSDMNLVPESFPVYYLKWEKLKAYLKERFPEHEFGDEVVHTDRYLFSIPQALNSVDHREIEKLRDMPIEARRDSQSPEPIA